MSRSWCMAFQRCASRMCCIRWSRHGCMEKMVISCSTAQFRLCRTRWLRRVPLPVHRLQVVHCIAEHGGLCWWDGIRGQGSDQAEESSSGKEGNFLMGREILAMVLDYFRTTSKDEDCSMPATSTSYSIVMTKRWISSSMLGLKSSPTWRLRIFHLTTHYVIICWGRSMVPRHCMSISRSSRVGQWWQEEVLQRTFGDHEEAHSSCTWRS